MVQKLNGGWGLITAPPIMKITFTSTRITKTVTYEEGVTYDLPDDEANKWKRNGVAHDVVEVKAIEEPARNKSIKKKTTRRKASK